jgi:ribosomal protein L37AE/L43A
MTNYEIVELEFLGRMTGDLEVRRASGKYGYVVVGSARSREAAEQLIEDDRAERENAPAVHLCDACQSEDIDFETHPDESYWRCYDCGYTWNED